MAGAAEEIFWLGARCHSRHSLVLPVFSGLPFT